MQFSEPIYQQKALSTILRILDDSNILPDYYLVIRKLYLLLSYEYQKSNYGLLQKSSNVCSDPVNR